MSPGHLRPETCQYSSPTVEGWSGRRMTCFPQNSQSPVTAGKLAVPSASDRSTNPLLYPPLSQENKSTLAEGKGEALGVGV